MANESVNYWKFATIGILLVGATVGATLLVVGRDSKTGSPDAQTAQASEPVLFDEHARIPGKMAPVEPQQGTRVAHSSRNTSGSLPPPPPYPPQAAYPPQPAYPPQSVMDACNRYANQQVSSKAENVLKNAALGAAIGAAVGAAGGAIAAGGSGAGKGAAIGGVTGVAGGTLYGLNESKSRDAQYQAAYASCMHSKGY
jgi:hypothetical protein